MEQNSIVTTENHPIVASKRTDAIFKQKKIILVAVNIVLISIFIKHLFYRECERKSSHNHVKQDNQSKPYADNDEEFLKLVDDTYPDGELVEWSPAPTYAGDPNEPGYLGAPVVVPPEKQEEAKRRFTENHFDIVASEMMPLNRTLADGRYPECLSVEYPKKLPTTSVIIVFHNEAWSTLLRTIWSVYRTAPRALLKEIILVDDDSDRDYLINDIHDYAKTFPVPLVIKRMITRAGLILARLLGAKYAKGHVLTFLDAHCECNVGWLEPLLARVAENRKVAIAPVIDKISDTDFGVELRKDEYAVFSWDLTFLWGVIPDRELKRVQGDRTLPLRTPAMAGGLFSIDKEYFYKSGSYDEKMRIWGSENIEMSLRLWTCGGMVEQHPCSRVGHVFRKNTPHTFPGGGIDKVIKFNAARLVETWIDEYKTWYEYLQPGTLKTLTDVSDRIELRKRLRCKSFDWYLKNIYPESALLLKYKKIGSFENLGQNNICLDSMARRLANSIVGASPCHNSGGNQFFMFSETNTIRKDDLCLEPTELSKPVRLQKCHDGDSQMWIYDETTLTFRYKNGNQCLTIKNGEAVTLEPCDGSAIQQWKHHNIVREPTKRSKPE